MGNDLRAFLRDYDAKKYATDVGVVVHKKMRFINVLNNKDKVVNQIKTRPELAMFFTPYAKTEVPISAVINGKFLSRRIDRMVIDEKNKVIHIMDYKTDMDKRAFHEKYVAQVHEYMTIMGKIYPKYKIYGYILWLHDWTLEKL